MEDEANELHPQQWSNSTCKHWKGIPGKVGRIAKDVELRKLGHV